MVCRVNSCYVSNHTIIIFIAAALLLVVSTLKAVKRNGVLSFFELHDEIFVSTGKGPSYGGYKCSYSIVLNKDMCCFLQCFTDITAVTSNTS